MLSILIRYEIVSTICGFIIFFFGIYLISLLALTFVYKRYAVSYFSAFASSQKLHLIEQFFRMVIGIALYIFSTSMLFPQFFRMFGLIIITSTLVLIIFPWTWHNKIGKKVIPLTIKYLPYYAFSAAIFGTFILYAVFKPLF